MQKPGATTAPGLGLRLVVLEAWQCLDVDVEVFDDGCQDLLAVGHVLEPSLGELATDGSFERADVAQLFAYLQCFRCQIACFFFECNDLVVQSCHAQLVKRKLSTGDSRFAVLDLVVESDIDYFLHSADTVINSSCVLAECPQAIAACCGVCFEVCWHVVPAGAFERFGFALDIFVDFCDLCLEVVGLERECSFCS